MSAIKRTLFALSAFFVFFVSAAGASYAQNGKPTPTPTPHINSAQAGVPAAGQVTISGSNFGTAGVVKLAGTVLTQASYMSTQIVANLPGGLAGSYLLTVTPTGGNQTAQFTLAVGVAGPQGPAGPAGPEGPQGPAGVVPAEVTDFVGRFGNESAPNPEFYNYAVEDPFNCVLGEVRLFAGDFNPGWTVIAAGQLMSIGQNVALFSLLGNKYGGNGQTTFALPNLRGLGPGGTNYVICIQGTYPSRPPQQQ
jgi:hypothetical protein